MQCGVLLAIAHVRRQTVCRSFHDARLLMQYRRFVLSYAPMVAQHSHPGHCEELPKPESPFCAGSLDADCPIWDHVVQLFVCCKGPDGSTSHCDKCDATPWTAMAADGEGSQNTLLKCSCLLDLCTAVKTHACLPRWELSSNLMGLLYRRDLDPPSQYQ